MFFFCFEEKPPFFYIPVWLWFHFKNNRRTNVLLIDIFENPKNTDQKNICVSTVFKGESVSKHKKIGFRVFFQKPKTQF